MLDQYVECAGRIYNAHLRCAQSVVRRRTNGATKRSGYLSALLKLKVNSAASAPRARQRRADAPRAKGARHDRPEGLDWRQRRSFEVDVRRKQRQRTGARDADDNAASRPS